MSSNSYHDSQMLLNFPIKIKNGYTKMSLIKKTNKIDGMSLKINLTCKGYRETPNHVMRFFLKKKKRKK